MSSWGSSSPTMKEEMGEVSHPAPPAADSTGPRQQKLAHLHGKQRFSFQGTV